MVGMEHITPPMPCLVQGRLGPSCSHDHPPITCRSIATPVQEALALPYCLPVANGIGTGCPASGRHLGNRNFFSHRFRPTPQVPGIRTTVGARIFNAPHALES